MLKPEPAAFLCLQAKAILAVNLHEHKEPDGQISGTDITHVGAMCRRINQVKFLFEKLLTVLPFFSG